jgi:hypothetical protein
MNTDNFQKRLMGPLEFDIGSVDVFRAGTGESQFACHGQLKQIISQESRRKEQHLEVLNLTGLRVEPSHYFIWEFL